MKAIAVDCVAAVIPPTMRPRKSSHRLPASAMTT